MRAFLLFPSVLAAAPAEVPPAPPATRADSARVYFEETPWFSISGADREANARAASIASFVGRAFAQYGFGPEALSPWRVVVYVTADAGAPSLNTAGGQTSVFLPRAALTDKNLCARSLVRGVLSRLAQAAGRTPAPETWAVDALAWEARVIEEPALFEFLLREAGEDGVPPVSEIVSAHAAASPVVRERRARCAFWLLRAVRHEEGLDPRVPVARAAVGTPPDVWMKECVADLRVGGERAESWWPAAFLRETEGRRTFVDSLAESPRRLKAFARFVVNENGRDVPLDARGLIARRADVSLAEAVRRRVMEIKLELPRANPVWHNAFLAYGLFLEKLPTAEPAELERLLEAARSEAEVSRGMSGEIRAALGMSASK